MVMILCAFTSIMALENDWYLANAKKRLYSVVREVARICRTMDFFCPSRYLKAEGDDAGAATFHPRHVKLYAEHEIQEPFENASMFSKPFRFAVYSSGWNASVGHEIRCHSVLDSGLLAATHTYRCL